MNRFESPVALCRFGLHRCDITPPPDIHHHMWGAATHDRAEGVHRPLTSTAMVFRPRSSEMDDFQVLVAIDHCVLLAPEMDALTGRLCSDHDIPQERIVYNFSHTHGAGLMDPRFTELPGGDLILPYLEAMRTRISKALGVALADTTEAMLTYTTGRCSLATHRDLWDEERKIFVCGFHPDGPSDDTVSLVRVTDAAGTPTAAIVNYGCHPTTLAWQNRLVSPDFPGATREVVEQATGVPCVFLQGASGDIGPKRGFVGDVEVADRNGRQLGYAALEAWESLPPPATSLVYTGPVISGATLGAWEDVPLEAEELATRAHWSRKEITLDIPYRPDLPTHEELTTDLRKWQEAERVALKDGREIEARDAHAEIERVGRWRTRIETLPPGEAYPYRIHLWRAGDGIWIGVEGEPYNLLQRALRERFPGVPIVVSTLSTGGFALYLPERETYGKGIYQESVALLEPGCLERVIEVAGDGIEKLLRPSG